MVRSPAPYLTRRSLLGAMALWPLAAGAQQGRPLLTLRQGTRTEVFDEAAFAALPQSTLRSRTAWTDGVMTFEGVLLRDFLAAAGVGAADLAGRQLGLTALNDYRIDIPAEDAFLYRTLLARRMNGQELQRSDKGPIWLVYPRDDHAELLDQRYDHRWAWQLAEISI